MAILSRTYEGPFSQSRELSSREPDAQVRITSRGGSLNSHQPYNASNGAGGCQPVAKHVTPFTGVYGWKLGSHFGYFAWKRAITLSKFQQFQ